MINMIKSDLYRISRKKSVYIFFAILIFLYTVLMVSGYITNSNDNFITPHFFENTLYSCLQIGIIFISINSFINVYGDDLSHGQIKHIVSVSSNNLFYLISKFIVLFIYVFLSYALLGVVFFLQMYIFSKGFYSNILPYIDIILSNAQIVFISYIATVLYVMTSAVMLYVTSRQVSALLWLTLFAMSFISYIIELLSNVIQIFKYISPYLLDNVIFKLTYVDSGFSLNYVFILLCYLLVSFALQLFFINTKEIK